jgi:hypothetical protein
LGVSKVFKKKWYPFSACLTSAERTANLMVVRGRSKALEAAGEGKIPRCTILVDGMGPQTDRQLHLLLTSASHLSSSSRYLQLRKPAPLAINLTNPSLTRRCRPTKTSTDDSQNRSCPQLTQCGVSLGFVRFAKSTGFCGFCTYYLPSSGLVRTGGPFLGKNIQPISPSRHRPFLFNRRDGRCETSAGSITRVTIRWPIRVRI